MLLNLTIHNYALISSLRVEFDGGLSTITGETGAGKSILMGALSLILGARADTGVLKNKDKKCVVEGQFSSTQVEVQDLLAANDLDRDQTIILRREIVPSGKSRAFVNDTPVNLNVLREFGQSLVNIHAQHQNLMLNQENFPILALDGFLKLDQDRNRYSLLYFDYLNKRTQFSTLKSKYDTEKRNQDFIEFQLNQLQEAKLDEDKQEDLENEREILEHSEEIQSKLAQFSFSIEESDQALLGELKQAIQSLKSVEQYFSSLADPIRRLDEGYLELKDIASEINGLLGQVDANPSRLQIIQERLDLFYTLQQKHQLGSQAELIALRTQLTEQLNEIEISSSQLDELEKELIQSKEILVKLGRELSEKRLSGCDTFCKEVELILFELGMPNAKFAISHSYLDEPKTDGLDEMGFLFSANKNQEPEEVSKVASGGEISRLMLSIKGLISSSLNVNTLIFDEIDAGVSGEIADKMGKLIKSISSGRQVLNITHLPQVARSGDHHYLVYKYDDEESTHTAMKKLDAEERVEQLARMLSGEELSKEALNNARQLLK